uniref:60S ribosome subunit biogenesis protein NIP7 pre-PUA domain-containing protein n=1 Tax=Gorilla gorilla gorilla TaxID=9595 RepID=A0A2I2Z0R0_GORGO
MRPLTEEETRVMFEKIVKYIRENLQLLLDRPDRTYCFWLYNDRVDYVSEKIVKLDASISRDKLVSLGTSLNYLAPYAKYKVWIKRAKSTQDCRKVDPMAIVVLHQADIGEYAQHEEMLT